MRTFEHRLYSNKAQHHLLMQCLSESRTIYNMMLAQMKPRYEQFGTSPTGYDLDKAFKGQREHVPVASVQMLTNRLSN
ncbi:MAG: hypothetical protein NVS4B7_17480 [Ktedonobacteraceae bacterium]